MCSLAKRRRCKIATTSPVDCGEPLQDWTNTPCNRATVQLLRRPGLPSHWLRSCVVAAGVGGATRRKLRNTGTVPPRALSSRSAVPLLQKGGGRRVARLTAFRRRHIQLEKSTRICQAHSDPSRCRGCFSSPHHPYPLPAGSHLARPPPLCLAPSSTACEHDAARRLLTAGATMMF